MEKLGELPNFQKAGVSFFYTLAFCVYTQQVFW